MNYLKNIVLHPFLIALYSILNLYAHNIGQVSPGQVLPLAAVVLAVTLALFALNWLLFRDQRKAGLLTTALLLVGLFYGNFATAINGWVRLPVVQIAVFAAVVILLGFIVLRLMRTPARLRNATTVFNTMAVVLLVIPALTVFSHEAFSSSVTSKHTATALQPDETDTVDVDMTARKRPVFFLIFDRYAANRTLKNHYAFDNQAIEDYLREKGFFVASDSYANYLKTAHSLAATFNMDYINSLEDQAGKGSHDWLPTYRILDNHRVLRTFKKLGYRYIHLGSWWEPTREHAMADENYNTDSVSEFTRVFINGTAKPFITETLLPALGLNALNTGPSGDFMKAHCARVPYKFAKLKELASRTDPIFVFAHILIPHPPFLFDENGRCKPEQETAQHTIAENYVGQVKYANKLMRDFIDTLLATADDPIIIIQADEGPFPLRYYNQVETDWRKATETELQIKFRILNTMYLPGVDQAKLSASMTPVNTFRLIFNEYFGAHLPLLEDHSYAIIDGVNHIYDFFEVTDAVR